MTMASALLRAPRTLAGHDLTARQAVVLAVIALTVIISLDLLDHRLGLPFSLGFVLVVATLPLAVRPDALFAAGVAPPVLFAAAMLLVSAFFGSALVLDGTPDDVGILGRALSGTIAFGVPLLIGHALALGVIVARIVNSPAPSR
ncbi:hypothetical protein JL108_16600 [Aeromicrobium sp. YIM 150415]|nr:DUF6542 domain-containing protein [Aeromicrobium sp. YIM 150415]MBM9465070.1 hypothetical protein [Aeromicrobium sp. YIM 150415]